MSKSEEAKLPDAKPQNQTLHVLYGESGSGKSALLDSYIRRHPNKIKLYRPETRNTPLIMTPDDYLSHAIIAVDELFKWDHASVPKAIRAMERAAIRQRRSLIVTVQNPDDLRLLGITFISTPALFAVNSPTTAEHFEELFSQLDGTTQA